MEKTTGIRYIFEFLPVASNVTTLHGLKGTETLCVACYHDCLNEIPPTELKRTTLETYTADSHRYVECTSCGECISER